MAMAMAMAMAVGKILISSSPPSSSPPTLPKPDFPKKSILFTRRSLLQICSSSLLTSSVLAETPSPSPSPKSSSSFLSGLANTTSWFQFYGDGFAIRVPPNFQDIMEPEVCLYCGFCRTIMLDYLSMEIKLNQRLMLHALHHLMAGMYHYLSWEGCYFDLNSLICDDLSEVVSVVIRPSNQLKITFLEAKDIADLGSLKEAAKIFIPGGATLYAARSIKIKEDEGYRNYYLYEFGIDQQHVALVAAVSSGKAIIAGATAPQNRWDDDGIRLRSSAVSLTLL